MEKLTLTNAKQYGKKSGIYHIVINGTEHHYVGSAKDLRKRLNAHRTALNRKKHENFKLQNCYNKYGLDNFEFEILEFCEIASLLKREAYFIKKLKPDLNIVQDPVELNRDEAFKERISKAKKKYYKTHRPVNIIKVYQYDKSGKFIKKYNSATEAANAVNGVVSGIIGACNGRAKTYKGFQWTKKFVHKAKSLIKEKPIRIKSKNPIIFNTKKVYQYDLDGNFIQEWPSASSAGRALCIEKRTISFCINKNYPQYKSAGGYQWTDVYKPNITKYENHSKDAKIKPIFILDVISLKEYKFDRIADAARLIGYTNFDSLCAAISSIADRGNGYIKNKYLVRRPNKLYKLGNSKSYININTGEIYKDFKDVPMNANVNKLSECAREKFRESEKNQEFAWSTLIEDL